jgi:hypothetical protein
MNRSLIIALFVIVGCTSEKNQFITKPKRENYLTDRKIELTLNGSYYATYQNPRDNSTELGYSFFYENGVALFSHAGEVKKDSILFEGYLRSYIEKDILFRNRFFKRKEARGFTLDSKCPFTPT